MRYEVWHSKELKTFMSPKPSFPEDYEQVAEVECVDEEDVFRATNHIDSDWTKNPEVKLRRNNPCRSTSVGDVIVDENGRGLYCAPVGWEDMGVLEIEKE